MNITNEAGLTQSEHAAWLDWMIYQHGIALDVAKTLTLAEPGDGDARTLAETLLAYWLDWREKPLEVSQ